MTTIFCLPITIVISYISAKVFVSHLINKYLVWGFLALWATLIVFCINKFTTSNCPRCGFSYLYDFWKYPFRRNTGIYERCKKCRLPIYFGSTYFYDYWGTEKGNELIQENKS